MQVQFVIAFVHAMVPFFYDCGYPKGFAYAVMGHALLFMVMFMNFYRNTYNKKRISAMEARDSSALKSNGTMANGKKEHNGTLPKHKNGTIVQEESARRKVGVKNE